MKHKGLLITGIVLLSLVVVALLGVMIYALAGNAPTFGLSIRTSAEVIYDESFEAVTELSVNSDCGDISFTENKNNKFQVTVYGENSDDVTVNFSDGKLEILYPQKKKLLSFVTVKNNIVVSLPAEYAGDIKVTSAYGDVALCALPAASVDIGCDYGSVSVDESQNARITNNYGDVTLGRAAVADIEVSLGKITVEAITQRCHLQNNCGDILVTEMAVTENSTVEDDLGNITIVDAAGLCVMAQTDLGSLNVAQNDPSSKIVLTVENSCGDINIGK